MSEHGHPSTKQYVTVFVILAVLTAVTVLLSKTGLSAEAKMFLAFSIAAIKTLFVATIFMHLKYETKPIIVFATVPLFLVVLFILAITPDVRTGG